MASYKNTNDAYGMSGPFEAESEEVLADQMTETFKIWANEKLNSQEILPEDIEDEIQSMREEFIAGLEQI